MELIWTSFGTSHLMVPQHASEDLFHRMPPVSQALDGHRFEPDYAALLIAERIVVDTKSFELLKERFHPAYSKVAETIQTLYSEGFVRLVDFDSIIDRNDQLLESALLHDMREPELWVSSLKEATSEWRRLVSNFADTVEPPFESLSARSARLRRGMPHPTLPFSLEVDSKRRSPVDLGIEILMHTRQIPSGNAAIDHLLNSKEWRHSERGKWFLENVLRAYLSYVNSNLLLSEIIGAGFYDWSDMKPFYTDKFLSVAKTAGYEDDLAEAASQLFDISFPEFRLSDAKGLMRILKDKRISELRSLIHSAAKGEVHFDKEFANRTLIDVLKMEESLGKIRNIMSYLTLPLEFVVPGGGLIAKATEEVVVSAVGRRKRNKHRWFYLLRKS